VYLPEKPAHFFVIIPWPSLFYPFAHEFDTAASGYVNFSFT